MTGLEVRDAGSSLELSACRVSNFPTANYDASGVRGVLVLSHASAELHGLTVRGMQCGVVVGMASANIMNCDVCDTLDSCIAFRAGATGKLENCLLAGSQEKHGLYASGGGTTVDAQNCRHAPCMFENMFQHCLHVCHARTSLCKQCCLLPSLRCCHVNFGDSALKAAGLLETRR